jgi:hypothetical protein
MLTLQLLLFENVNSFIQWYGFDQLEVKTCLLLYLMTTWTIIWKLHSQLRLHSQFEGLRIKGNHWVLFNAWSWLVFWDIKRYDSVWCDWFPELAERDSIPEVLNRFCTISISQFGYRLDSGDVLMWKTCTSILFYSVLKIASRYHSYTPSIVRG